MAVALPPPVAVAQWRQGRPRFGHHGHHGHHGGGGHHGGPGDEGEEGLDFDPYEVLGVGAYRPASTWHQARCRRLIDTDHRTGSRASCRYIFASSLTTHVVLYSLAATLPPDVPALYALHMT